MDTQVIYHADGVVLRFSGSVDARTLMEARLQAYSLPEVGKLRSVMLDFSEATGCDLPTWSIRRWAEVDRLFAEENPWARIVVVAPQDLFYGLARMWQGFMGGRSDLSAVVRTRRDADRWLEPWESSLRMAA